MRSIVYASTAAFAMTAAELESLLLECRRLNHSYGITGVLLCCDGRFMQYFEGPEQEVHETYQRIRASRRHTNLVELMNQRVRCRSFSAWDMGLALPAPSEMLALSTARWAAQATAEPHGSAHSPGFELLLQFWRSEHQHALP